MFIAGIINSGYRDLEKPILGTLSYSNVVRGSVDLTCAATDNKGVESFKIYIDSVLFTTINTTSLENFTIAGIPGGQNIDVFVVAVDINSNESLPSNIVNFDTVIDDAPVIGTLTYANEGYVSVELSCTATDDYAVVSFDIYVDDVFDRNVVGSSLSSYVLDGLTELTTYSIKVEAIDDADQKSGFSNSVSVTTTAAPSVPLGLSPALISVPAQNDAAWTLRSFDASDYIGATCRLVVRVKVGPSGTTYFSDTQIDDITLGSNFWDPETGTNGFERDSFTATVGKLYENVNWTGLLDGNSGVYWHRDSNGTGSSSTGNTSGNTGSYYYYTEGSGSANDASFWLRSPAVVVDTSTLQLYTAQYGATCGPIDVYIDVISF